jgi:hypothetical protein
MGSGLESGLGRAAQYGRRMKEAVERQRTVVILRFRDGENEPVPLALFDVGEKVVVPARDDYR